MSKSRLKRKQDTSWIWLCSLLAVFFISLIVCYGRGSLRANGSYHETVSSVAESTKLTPYTPPTLKSLIVHPESTDEEIASLTSFARNDRLEGIAKELIDYFFLGVTLFRTNCPKFALSSYSIELGEMEVEARKRWD
ncbi:hypothetical protein ACFL2I_05045 [Candidatus Omnitrophota bacterium]